MEVALFIPCYIDQFYPKVAIATLELLEKNGITVHYPNQQTCCGQPLANSGMEKAAIPIYQHFIEVFGEFDCIVVPSASCAYHVRAHYDILPQDERLKALRKNTLDLAVFLNERVPDLQLSAHFPHKVAIHQSCHGLRGLRIAQSSERVLPHYSLWEDLLNKVEGLELTQLEFPDECCGFGGTYSVTEPELSVKMGKDKIQAFIDSGVEFVTSGDMSCLMHMDGIIRRNKLPIQTIHFAEILNYSNEKTS